MMATSEQIQETRKAITRKKEELTVPEKIILHLGMYRRQFDVYDISMMLTQDGIAYATDVKRAQVSVELKKLLRKSIVAMELAHVPKSRKKRKTNLLAEKGYELSERLDDKLTNENIDVCEILSC